MEKKVCKDFKDGKCTFVANCIYKNYGTLECNEEVERLRREKEVDSIVETIKAAAKEALNGTKVGAVAIEKAKYITKYIMSCRVHSNDAHYLKFDVEFNTENPAEIIIKPGNLFSFLISRGIEVTYNEVRDKSEYKTDIGTFAFKNGQCLFQPIFPIEYITVEFSYDIEKGETK